MTIERTFSMIKPDATERNLVGSITAMIESSGLKVIASRRTKMTPEKAAEFYGVHSDRPFFQSLCDFMCSGPIIVQVLEGENAVKKNREIIYRIYTGRYAGTMKINVCCTSPDYFVSALEKHVFV